MTQYGSMPPPLPHPSSLSKMGKGGDFTPKGRQSADTNSTRESVSPTSSTSKKQTGRNARTTHSTALKKTSKVDAPKKHNNASTRRVEGKNSVKDAVGYGKKAFSSLKSSISGNTEKNSHPFTRKSSSASTPKGSRGTEKADTIRKANYKGTSASPQSSPKDTSRTVKTFDGESGRVTTKVTHTPPRVPKDIPGEEDKHHDDAVVIESPDKDNSDSGNATDEDKTSREESLPGGARFANPAPAKKKKKKSNVNIFSVVTSVWFMAIVVSATVVAGWGYKVYTDAEMSKVESRAYQDAIASSEEKGTIDSVMRIPVEDINKKIVEAPGAYFPANPVLSQHLITGWSEPSGDETKGTVKMSLCYTGDGVKKPKKASAYFTSDDANEKSPHWNIDSVSVTGNPCKE